MEAANVQKGGRGGEEGSGREEGKKGSRQIPSRGGRGSTRPTSDLGVALPLHSTTGTMSSTRRAISQLSPAASRFASTSATTPTAAATPAPLSAKQRAKEQAWQQMLNKVQQRRANRYTGKLPVQPTARSPHASKGSPPRTFLQRTTLSSSAPRRTVPPRTNHTKPFSPHQLPPL